MLSLQASGTQGQEQLTTRIVVALQKLFPGKNIQTELSEGYSRIGITVELGSTKEYENFKLDGFVVFTCVKADNPTQKYYYLQIDPNYAIDDRLVNFLESKNKRLHSVD